MTTKAPPEPLKTELAYVTAVAKTCNDRAARAALRKGLGRTSEKAESMDRHIAALIPLGTHPARENAQYAIAALIAANGVAESTDGPAHNFGHILAVAVGSGALRERSAETRLRLLTRRDQIGLITYLPKTIPRLSGLFTPLDWAQLLADLTWWPRSRLTTGKRWRQAFWRQRSTKPANTSDDTDPAANSS